MRRVTAVLAVMGFGLIGAPAATADPVVLGSGVLFLHGGGTAPPGTVDPTATGVFWVAMPLGPDPGPLERLFNVPLTPDDVGRTFRATAETDPAFAGVAARLTNGGNDFLSHALTFPDGLFITSSILESSLFHPGGGPPDFAGSTITALTFRLTHLSVDADPGRRDLRYEGLLSVEGLSADPVPEPSTLLLLGTGAAAIARRVRRNGSVRRR
jgi:hypothetical protein